MTHTPSTDAVELRDLHRSFAGVRAVDGLDLTIPRGQTVAILGRNGAGKSTTVNMLLGLLPPDRGSVRVWGLSPAQAGARGLVGAMLQETQPIASVRVRELLDFLRACYPDPLPLEEVLSLAHVDDVADRELPRLSGGQMQRVKFAMAVVGRPDLLVLDEPTAAMDVESRRAFWAAMRDYAAQGRTVCFSTHYVEEADTADRVVVIDRGRVVADDSPRALRARTGEQVVTVTSADGGAGLEPLPGVVSVAPLHGRVRLSTTDVDATVSALVAQGRLRDLEVRTPDLEDAFLSLVGADQG